MSFWYFYVVSCNDNAIFVGFSVISPESLALLSFKVLVKHAWGRPLLQLAAWNVIWENCHQRYFPATYLKLLTTSILPVGQRTLYKSTLLLLPLLLIKRKWEWCIFLDRNIFFHIFLNKLYEFIIKRKF